MTIFISLALLAIVAALASAGFFMLRGPGKGHNDGNNESNIEGNNDNEGKGPAARQGRMARALAWRVGLSIMLFLAVLLAYALGWIEPRGIPLGA